MRQLPEPAEAAVARFEEFLRLADTIAAREDERGLQTMARKADLAGAAQILDALRQDYRRRQQG
ncbi:hypothetical protein [Streptomyces sp. WM6378]|uniref:hypothetical protein n=1 Tax=Streptomyces sp. WM6378 TaxID=1415557 RepID=UPI00131D4A53|nr:hypothetical protein [Streptomyces sp. WM6378]